MVSPVWMVDGKAMMKAMFGISIIDDWGKKVINEEKFPYAYGQLNEE